MCQELGIKNTCKISIESHKSNGRVEQIIGTIREGLAKDKKGTIADRLNRIITAYNDTYHSGIKCTPNEAMSGEKSETVKQENGTEGKYKEKFKKRFREKFKAGQDVRVAKRENLGNESKGAKGRFLGKGLVTEVCEGDSYLVKGSDGRITKRRHYDLKPLNDDEIIA